MGFFVSLPLYLHLQGQEFFFLLNEMSAWLNFVTSPPTHKNFLDRKRVYFLEILMDKKLQSRLEPVSFKKDSSPP